MVDIIQCSYVCGEIAPAVMGRTDKPQYRNGASTMRNAFVRYTGGSSSRAGLAYCGMCKQAAPNVGGTSTDNAPRIIQFQYSVNQGFTLEFGDQYMRIVSNGAYVTEAPKPITLITQSNPAIFQIIAHGYSVGDWIYIVDAAGMTNFNGLTWIVSNVIDVNNISVTDLFGNTIDSSSFTAYTSGGVTARLYTVVSPYAAIDLPYLKFTQSSNVMTLCCVNQQTLTEYNIYDLQRFGNNNWQFGAVSFSSAIGPPSGVKVTALNSTTVNTNYGYCVTAISADTGEESVASSIVTIGNNNISINAGSNTISWNAVPGAKQYNVYMTTPAFQPGSVSDPSLPFGFIGTTIGTNFTDSNITPDFSTTPPLHNDPFALSGILGAQVTAGGDGNYTQSNIGYVINTTTGTGAVLQLSVNNGYLSGITSTSQGQNYNPLTDTITITSGGVNPPIAATGTYTFITNPSDGQNIVLNGNTIIFSASGTTGCLIGGTLSLTLQNLIAFIANINLPVLNVASYSIAGSVLNITYKTVGLVGNGYTLGVGSYGGVISAATLTGGSDGGGVGGTGATATLTFTQPTGNTPSVVDYYQQRRVYANTTNMPDTYFFSKPGAFENMDSAIPTIDSDAIIGTPWAKQINGIQFFQPTQNGLLTFTGNGVWDLSGGNSVAITPSDQNAQAQAQVGCSSIVAPLYINQHVLYVQSKNSIVRDIAYNFIYSMFQGTDITFWSTHLFQNYSILQWCYAEEPFKIVWALRNDGQMLSLTYVKEQEIEGWARHDTNGFFIGTCTVTEKHITDIHDPTQFGPLVDAPYFITQRYITGEGVWAYYNERMDDRNWFNVEDCFCVDAGLSYPMTYPQAKLYPAATDGTHNITSTLVINGGSGYTAPTATAVDADGSGATFSVTVVGGIITAVTSLTSGTDYVAGQTEIVITDTTGSGAVVQPIITNYVTFTASSSVFTAGMVGDVLRVDNGKATIISQTGTACIADVTQPLTLIIQNDPNEMPVPAQAGQWSVATPTSIVRGLNHLEGMTVTGLADGGVITPVTVVGGSITLPEPASAIVVGLPFTVQVQTPRLEIPSQTTTQGKRKNLTSVILRVEASRGFSVGANQVDSSSTPDQAVLPWVNLDEYKQRGADVAAGSSIPLFSGDTDPINISSTWDEKGQFAVEQSYPLPLNALAAIVNFCVGDTQN